MECVNYLVGQQRIGPRRWIHGELWIQGRRDGPDRPGVAIKDQIAEPLDFGTSRAVTIPPKSKKCETKAWSVAVSLTYPGGVKIDLPPRSGEGPLTAAEAGAKFEWQPLTHTLTVVTPPSLCGGI